MNRIVTLLSALRSWPYRPVHRELSFHTRWGAAEAARTLRRARYLRHGQRSVEESGRPAALHQGSAVRSENGSTEQLSTEQLQNAEAAPPEVTVFTGEGRPHSGENNWGVVIPGADHTRFSEVARAPVGRWLEQPYEYLGSSPERSALWAKTHPHMLFPGVRWAVYLDCRLVEVPDLERGLTGFQGSGHPLAVRRGQSNTTVSEALSRARKEGQVNTVLLRKERHRLGALSVERQLDTQIVFFDLTHPALSRLLSLWWTLIDTGSNLDSLSLLSAGQRARVPIWLWDEDKSLNLDEQGPAEVDAIWHDVRRLAGLRRTESTTAPGVASRGVEVGQ